MTTMTTLVPEPRRPLLSMEERARRVRQQMLGRRLSQSFEGVERQAVPDDFMELLRLADKRSAGRSE